MLRRLFESSFIRFCFVGGVSTVLDMSVLYILVEYAEISVLTAASIGFLIGTFSGFFFNRIFTFRSKNTKIFWQYTQYFIVALVALLLTLLLIKYFIEALHIHYLLAKFITIFVVLIWTFSSSKFFVFKH